MRLELPARPADGHKGTFGSLAIIGGQISNDKVMLGSVAFAAKAAIRSGVGLVYFGGQKNVLVELVKMVPQAVGQTIKDLSARDAIVIGPGLGQTEKARSILEYVLNLNLPIVVDADGLNILASRPEMLKSVHAKCVLTPHPGEFERIAKTCKIKTAGELAKKLGCCVVLKGHETTVTTSRQSWISKISNPALAAGGSGDVLAGLIGGLLTQYYQKLSIFDCACLGVEIHSKSGLAWSQRHGPAGLFIDELIDLIPETMAELRN